MPFGGSSVFKPYRRDPARRSPWRAVALGKGGFSKKIALSISHLLRGIGVNPRNDLAKSAGLQHAFLDKQSRAADAL
jgi:hypothetical protein